MEFKEFKEEFEETYVYQTDVYSITLHVTKDDSAYYLWTIVHCGKIDLGKYNTLREAYEALKEICKLNNVEME